MKYRELQVAIKQFRTQGLTDKTFKLNQKKTDLMCEYERVTKLDIRSDKSTDMDEVSLLKIRIGELESENKTLKNKLDIANETIDYLFECVDSTTTKFDEYIENVSELVKESYQSGYNDCKKVLEFDETLPDHPKYHVEYNDIANEATITRLDYKHPKYEESVNIDDDSDNGTSSSTNAVINHPEIGEKIDYEIIKCEYGEMIESEITIDIKFEDDGNR